MAAPVSLCRTEQRHVSPDTIAVSFFDVVLDSDGDLIATLEGPTFLAHGLKLVGNTAHLQTGDTIVAIAGLCGGPDSHGWTLDAEALAALPYADAERFRNRAFSDMTVRHI
jgi:hypothetical protein